MNSQHYKYLVAGSGLAGSSAIEAIRRRDPEGSLLLVGQEISQPYHRPPLSKAYLRKQTSRGDLTTLPVNWYADRQVELRTGRRVTAIDAGRAAVTLDDGQEVSFDSMLLAVGASAAPLKVPGANLPNVYYLRTIEDADRLLHAIDKARAEGRPHPVAASAPVAAEVGTRVPSAAIAGSTGRGRAAVIGAGLLGVEVAASLRQNGLHVELMNAHNLPWSDIAGEATGRFVTRLLEDNGVVVHQASAALRLEGDGRAQRVIASNHETGEQRVDCDFVVAAVGIVPHRELVRGTPIAAEMAILTDERCRTSAPGIFAAGDCAAIRDPLFGKHRLIDHWDHARVSGAIAGANMAQLGGCGTEDTLSDLTYHLVNHFDTEVLGVRIDVWGESRLVVRRLLRGTLSQSTPQFAEIGVAADGRVAQVLSIGREQEHAAFEQLVAARLDATAIEGQLKDPDLNLATLLPQ
jgi:3-phenylpropionate/trans-cinnamate dioxygenase ferredoxin reductase component